MRSCFRPGLSLTSALLLSLAAGCSAGAEDTDPSNRATEDAGGDDGADDDSRGDDSADDDTPAGDDDSTRRDAEAPAIDGDDDDDDAVDAGPREQSPDDPVEAGADDDDVPDVETDAGPPAGDDDLDRGDGSHVQGRVQEIDGTAVTDVIVTAAGVESRTDNRGIFVLESMPEGPLDVFVRSSTHTRGHARVDLGDAETVGLLIQVIPLVTGVLPDAAAGGTMQGTDGVAVTVPAGSLFDAAGNPVSGAVDVSYALLNDSETLAAAPGGMLAMRDSRDAEQLESFGMVDMSFSQAGEPLTFEGTAELTFPLAATHPFAEGDTVGLFGFDEEIGMWVEEGQGTVASGMFVADVSHFSWWNCDQPLANKSCLSGQVVDDDGAPLPNFGLSVTGVDYLTNLRTTTDADGAFCVTVKRASSNRITGFGGGQGAFYGLDATAQSGGAAAECGGDGCVDVGALNAEPVLTNCREKTVAGTDHVYLMSSGDAALDQALEMALASQDQTVTMGAEYTAFTGIDLAPYDAVYLQANANWNAGDMPEEGQIALVDWVNCGGGLVAVEWVLWKTASGSFAVLDHAFPAVPTTSFTSSSLDITYGEAEADPIFSAGLPAEFTFVADDFSGSETDMSARPGAVVFYDSVALGAGVVGWSYNHGKVVNVSTVAGMGQLADVNYARMLSNAFDWARGIERNRRARAR